MRVYTAPTLTGPHPLLVCPAEECGKAWAGHTDDEKRECARGIKLMGWV